jgi:hypothetical protein
MDKCRPAGILLIYPWGPSLRKFFHSRVLFEPRTFVYSARRVKIEEFYHKFFLENIPFAISDDPLTWRPFGKLVSRAQRFGKTAAEGISLEKELLTSLIRLL